MAQSRAGGLQNGSFYVRARDAAGNLSIASDTVVTPSPTSVPPSASASASPPPVSTCAFEYRVTNRWNGGFAATWKLTDTSDAPITGCSVSLQFSGDGRLSQGWNAVYAQSGQTLTLGDVSWNRVIPPGGSTNGGFLAWVTPPPPRRARPPWPGAPACSADTAVPRTTSVARPPSLPQNLVQEAS